MAEKEKGLATAGDQTPPTLPPYYQYGTFQGVSSSSSGRPPLPPHHVVSVPNHGPVPSSPYDYGYQTIPGYVIAEGIAVREPSLPCCGFGMGWFLFLAGFFFAAIPWYVGALILLCVGVDYREKPGLVACMIASILAMIAVVFGVAKGADAW